jgi:hypothetical protein
VGAISAAVGELKLVWVKTGDAQARILIVITNTGKNNFNFFIANPFINPGWI